MAIMWTLTEALGGTRAASPTKRASSTSVAPVNVSSNRFLDATMARHDRRRPSTEVRKASFTAYVFCGGSWDSGWMSNTFEAARGGRGSNNEKGEGSADVVSDEGARGCGSKDGVNGPEFIFLFFFGH